MGVRRGNIKYTTLEGDQVAIPGTAQMTSDEIKDKWLLSHVKTLRAGMQSDKLYPPGDVYILVSASLRLRRRADAAGLPGVLCLGQGCCRDSVSWRQANAAKRGPSGCESHCAYEREDADDRLCTSASLCMSGSESVSGRAPRDCGRADPQRSLRRRC